MMPDPNAPPYNPRLEIRVRTEDENGVSSWRVMPLDDEQIKHLRMNRHVEAWKEFMDGRSPSEINASNILAVVRLLAVVTSALCRQCFGMEFDNDQTEV